MAKKTVASFKDKSAGKSYTKVIKLVKSPKGAYSFKEEMVPNEMVNSVLAGK
ncbi:MAG: DUF4295 domain-containing protein [Flavobacteriales bacterium]